MRVEIDCCGAAAAAKRSSIGGGCMQAHELEIAAVAGIRSYVALACAVSALLTAVKALQIVCVMADEPLGAFKALL